MMGIQTTFSKRDLQRLQSALDFWLLKAKQKEVFLDDSEGKAVLYLRTRVRDLLEAIDNA